ncbi:MAG: WD40 repeat domain-containing protein [Nitrospirota bacterium]
MPRLAKRQAVVRLRPGGSVRLADYVHRVAFSADGRRLAACSASGEVAVWDVPSLTPVCQPTGHRESALALAWHPVRHALATGGQDGVVRMWMTDMGEERAVLPVGPPSSWVDHLAWSPDGVWLAASGGKTLRVWTTRGDDAPQPAGEVLAHQTTISALAWMPRGGGVITACYGGAWLWTIGEDKPVRSFPYDGALLSIAVSPGGGFLASGNLDGSVHLFRTENEQNWHMSGYPMKVTCVRFDHDGMNLFTASGPALMSWNMKKFEGTGGRLFKGHLGWIREIACHPSHSLVATAGEDGFLCLWEPRTTKPMVIEEINTTGGLSCVAWSSTGTRVATGADDGAVSLLFVEGLGD